MSLREWDPGNTCEQGVAADRQPLHNFNPNRPAVTRRQDIDVVRRAKQGASYQVNDLMFQNLASRNYRVLQT